MKKPFAYPLFVAGLAVVCVLGLTLGGTVTADDFEDPIVELVVGGRDMGELDIDTKDAREAEIVAAQTLNSDETDVGDEAESDPSLCD